MYIGSSVQKLPFVLPGGRAFWARAGTQDGCVQTSLSALLLSPIQWAPKAFRRSVHPGESCTLYKCCTVACLTACRGSLIAVMTECFLPVCFFVSFLWMEPFNVTELGWAENCFYMTSLDFSSEFQCVISDCVDKFITWVGEWASLEEPKCFLFSTSKHQRL